MTFETSKYISRIYIDPKTLQPPQSLNTRDKVDSLRSELLFPKSPAFCNNFKKEQKKKVEELKQLAQYAQQKNIPFNVEEQNFYRSRQCQNRFQKFTHTMN